MKTVAEFRAYERRLPRYIDHEELLYTMHELSRLISVHFDKVMARHQLTHSQWWALMHIFEQEGVTQTELAVIMQLGRASAGGVLERLEAKGWIERRADPKDNRVRRVYLCDAAVPVFELMNEEGQRVFKTWLKGVGPDKEEEALKVLRLIRANAGGHTD
ncbi:MarR family transcriptional regulator [Devosia sp.]|uniref:MarR family winged helix-turn-helix transcriptional regulator n=1 Tax=Devosia sp. TaxID=1871048 RepID=UPI00262BC422|nr:MarR family transcriptional regulator [Devosia sp.]